MALHPSGITTYKQAGVDIEAGNALVQRLITRQGKATRCTGDNGALGGFGGLFDLAACKFNDPILVAANDGVGTKLKIAIETGRHDTIGIDLVAMCANDLIVQGATPLFFLDYFATGKLDVDVAETVIGGIAKGCKQANCALIGGETAEMPDLYAPRDYDLAGFAVGAVERANLLPQNVGVGDVVLGLPSSGIHANGFSLVRKLVAQAGLDWDDKCPTDSGKNLADTLLTSTKIYVKPILGALKIFNDSKAIHALAHITGGGLFENLPRVLPDGVGAQIDAKAWQRPAIFDWLQQSGKIDPMEMMRVFNCGIGMVVVVDAQMSDDIIAAFADMGETAVPIGQLYKTDDTQVTINNLCDG